MSIPSASSLKCVCSVAKLVLREFIETGHTLKREGAQRFLKATPRLGCGGNLGRQGSSAPGS